MPTSTGTDSQQADSEGTSRMSGPVLGSHSASNQSADWPPITDPLTVHRGSLHRSFTGNVSPSYEGLEGPQMIDHNSLPSSNILPSHSLADRPIRSNAYDVGITPFFGWPIQGPIYPAPISSAENATLFSPLAVSGGAEGLSSAFSSQENVRTLWSNPGLANGAVSDANLIMILGHLAQSVGCRLEPLSTREMQTGSGAKWP